MSRCTEGRHFLILSLGSLHELNSPAVKHLRIAVVSLLSHARSCWMDSDSRLQHCCIRSDQIFSHIILSRSHWMKQNCPNALSNCWYQEPDIKNTVCMKTCHVSAFFHDTHTTNQLLTCLWVPTLLGGYLLVLGIQHNSAFHMWLLLEEKMWWSTLFKGTKWHSLAAFSTGSFFYKRDFQWTYFVASRLKKLLTSLLLPDHQKKSNESIPKILWPPKNWSIWSIHPYWVRHFPHDFPSPWHNTMPYWDSLTAISPPSELVPPDLPAFRGGWKIPGYPWHGGGLVRCYIRYLSPKQKRT